MNVQNAASSTPRSPPDRSPGSRKIYVAPEAAPDLRVAVPRGRAASQRPASRRCRSTTPSGPYTDPAGAIDIEQGLPRAARRLGARARRRRGVRRPRREAGGQRRHAGDKHLAPAVPDRATGRCAAAAGGSGDPARIRARRHHHPGDGIRRHPRESRPQAAARARRGRARRRRGLRRRDPGLRHAGIRARRGRARPRHHPGQHQPSRARADDHRPQLPGQDQRQYRQLGRDLRRSPRKSRRWSGRSAGAPTR